MKLEQIFESHYVGPAAYIRNTRPVELLDIVESVKTEYPAVIEVLKALHTNKALINESVFDEDSQIVVVAFQKLLEYYNTQNDKEFNIRLQNILEDYAAYTSGPPAAAAPKQGVLGKAKSFLGKITTGIAKSLGSLAGSVAAGYKNAAAAGAQGKTNTGQTVPGWQDVNTEMDLKSIPSKETGLTLQQVQNYNVDQNTIESLKQGNIRGINLQNPKTNQLAQLTFNAKTGLFSIRQIVLTPAAPAAAPAAPTNTVAAPAANVAAESQKYSTSYSKTYHKVLKEYYKTSK